MCRHQNRACEEEIVPSFAIQPTHHPENDFSADVPGFSDNDKMNEVIDAAIPPIATPARITWSSECARAKLPSHRPIRTNQRDAKR